MGRLIHGHARNRTSGQTPTYRTWAAMIGRCERLGHPGYFKYGARGITVCAEWHDFDFFLAEMGERPEGCTLDRIRGAMVYSRATCRWATQSEQALNRNSVKISLVDRERIRDLLRMGIKNARIGNWLGFSPQAVWYAARARNA